MLLEQARTYSLTFLYEISEQILDLVIRKIFSCRVNLPAVLDGDKYVILGIQGPS